WKEKKMNKSNDILKETDCLSEQKMRDYLQGKLNRREVYEVETHIASCHFCAEALDGLSQMKRPEELPVIVKQVQHRFRRQLRLRSTSGRSRKLKGYVRLTLIAFIILVILLLAYFAIDFTMKKERRLHQSAPVQEQKDEIQP